MNRNLVVEPDLCPARRPFVFNRGHKLYPISITVWMKGNTPELSAKGFVANPSLLLLVMKIIVLHKVLHCRLATARKNNP
jgi:hypothetical protein